MEQQTSEGTNAAAPTTRGSRGLKAAGLIAAGVIAGGTLAATMSAHAADAPSTAPSTTSNASPEGSTTPNGAPPQATAPSSANGAPNGQRGPGGPGGAAAVRSDEKVLTGSDLASAKTAALKAVPGGTIVRAETDAGDATYEVHMTKADGTVVTVKLDKSFSVTAVESGMGKGDPTSGGPKGQHGQPPAGQPNGQPNNSSSSSSNGSSGA